MAKSEYNKAYYKKHKERLKEAARENYYVNRELRNAQNKRWYEENKDRARELHRAWRKKNIEHVKARAKLKAYFKRFSQYGLTPESYQEMLEAQNGVCAICFQKCIILNDLAIDHDHDLGLVRGLLCKRCNSGLGFFRESPELLVQASEYLAHPVKGGSRDTS